MKKNKNILPKQLGDAHIRLLRIFKVVIESGGFSVAEVELNISRPAISIAITELELLLDMKLCHRGRSGFSITEHGDKVYRSALQLLGNIENFKAEMNAINTELVGEFNIGITDNLVTIKQMRITRALSMLKNRAPEVVIHIRMIPPNEIESAILNGQLHIGVVPQFRTLPGLNYLPLYKEESLLYCSVKHQFISKNLHQISDQSIGEFDAVVPSYPQSVDIKQQQKKLRATATSTDREGIAFLILTGQFIGFLPTHFAKRWVENGEIQAINVETRKFNTNFSAITSKGARSHLILDAYLEELAKT